MRERFVEKYPVRKILLGALGVTGLAAVMGFDTLLPHSLSLPNIVVSPAYTPTSTPVPTIRIKILPTPLGPFDSITDCDRLLVTKRSAWCLDNWGTPTPR